MHESRRHKVDWLLSVPLFDGLAGAEHILDRCARRDPNANKATTKQKRPQPPPQKRTQPQRSRLDGWVGWVAVEPVRRVRRGWTGRARRLAGLLSPRAVEPGEMLIVKGDTSAAEMYFIRGGELQVRDRHSNNTTRH